MNAQVHLSLQDDVDDLWEETRASNGTAADAYEYEFKHVCTDLLAQRWLVRHTLSTFSPARVFLPSQCRESVGSATSHLHFLESMFYRVLEEETKHTSRSYFVEGHREALVRIKDNFGVSIMPLVAEFGYRARRHMRQRYLIARGSRIVKRKPGPTKALILQMLIRPRWRQGAKNKKVLVIAQFQKVTSLMIPGFADAQISYLSYSKFEKLVATNKENHSANSIPIPMDSAQNMLLNYFRAIISGTQFSHEALDQLLLSDWSILVTDAQHMPLMRELVNGALEIGKPVAVVPEGAISYVGFQERFGGTSLFIADPRITRFVLDVAQKDYWLRLGVPPGRIHVSGFLGDDPARFDNMLRLPSMFLGASMRPLKTRHISCTVMITLDSSLEGKLTGHFGMPLRSATLHNLVLIIDELVARGYRVLGKTRDKDFTYYLKRRFQGRPAFFTTYIPWQVLAERADLVLSRDSSVGWQSVAGGTPVLVWNFSDYPSFIEVTLDPIPDYWMGIARSVGELDVAIKGLLARHHEATLAFGTNGVLVPPVQSRPDVVKSWIEAGPYS